MNENLCKAAMASHSGGLSELESLVSMLHETAARLEGKVDLLQEKLGAPAVYDVPRVDSGKETTTLISGNRLQLAIHNIRNVGARLEEVGNVLHDKLSQLD